MDIDDEWEQFSKNVRAIKKQDRFYAPVRDASFDYVLGDNEFQRINSSLSHSFGTYHGHHASVHLNHCRYFKNKIIETRVDLHGLTSVQAETVLHQFFIHAQNNAYKYGCIITGKGASKNSSEKGILQRFAEHFFQTHSHYVVTFSVAPLHEGGKGAYLVHIRKKKQSFDF